jgi:NADPH2:quinone reductase
MKAIRVHEFGSPENMRIEEVDDPRPGPRQLVIAVKAAGINPIDTYIRSGTYAKKKPALPYTPGFDAAGVVESIGANVRRFKPGDRVYINGNVTGAYAQKTLCELDSVFALPDHLSFEQGSGVWVPYATAHQAIFHVARARAGETLLVRGASGGVGSACVQTARALGLRVIGTAGSEKGRHMLLELGVHAALDHHAGDLTTQVLNTTEGRGPDIIIEMLANANLSKDLGLIAHRGRIVLIGNRGTIEINPRDAMNRDAAILGMLLLNATPDEISRISAGLAAGLENKTLNPIVGRTFPLEQAPHAHEVVLAPGALGKIALIP